MIRRSALCLALLASLAAFFLAASAAAQAPDLRSTVARFAALEDRGLGTPGCAQAADILEQAFRDAFGGVEGAVIARQRFHTPVQRHRGSSITRLDTGASASLFPLRLNALATGAIGPPGYEGELIYAGRGELGDFNGLDPSGRIVLMDMDSGKNWQNAAMLGARALIFLDSNELPGGGEDQAPRRRFEDKHELTPLDFPRFWMPEAQAREFLQVQGPFAARRILGEAGLLSAMAWENTAGENVYCFVPGSDPGLAEELVIVQAFYDSTAYVPGLSPGADEAVSAATLLETAAALAAAPPRRSVLLAATAGQAQGLAGMREFVGAFAAEEDLLADWREDMAERIGQAEEALELLRTPDPLAALGNPEQAEILGRAYADLLKDQVDAISRELMRLRLEQGGEQERIIALAEERMRYMRLQWASREFGQAEATAEQMEMLQALLPEAILRQEAMLADSRSQMEDMDDALALREIVSGRNIVAGACLYLSSHGMGLGAFDKGWFYDLYPEVNRTRFFSPLDELLRGAAARIEDADPGLPGGFFQDTLRPNPFMPWQCHLPDNPSLAAEPLALAAERGLSLATVFDARGAWGTPYDTVERVDFGFAGRQARMVAGLVQALCTEPITDSGGKPKNGFATVWGRANLLRQGEIFPDRPASGAVFLVYQYMSLLYAMVDASGTFRITGLATREHMEHKAILEGYRFDPETGRAVWAVDKPMTGIDNYRIKLKKNFGETNLVLFGCAQSTLFHTLEPRTFNYLYTPGLYDARTEAEPLRYWFSRLDTRTSSNMSLFLEPDVPFKLTLTDSLTGIKTLLTNASGEHPEGRGFLVREHPRLPLTELQAASDMWNLIDPRLNNLEARGISNERLHELRARGVEALERAEVRRGERIWDECLNSARQSLAIASTVYTNLEATQKDVLGSVLFYVALFVPFAYCLERLLFGFASVNRRIAAFLGILLAIIAVVYWAHPAFELTYSPSVVILAFFILGLSFLVTLIIVSRFEREMKDMQRRSRRLALSETSKVAAFAAAFGLGVSNLRRRPIRTALTCLTLIILSFTVMNFTTVKSVLVKGWSRFAGQASYDGAMLKNLGWKTLPVEALSVVQDMAGGDEAVGPRVWYETEDLTKANVIHVHRGHEMAIARGMIGLSASEPSISGLDQALEAGRWFGPGEVYGVILPRQLADQIGVDLAGPASRHVNIWGLDFEVTGILADQALRDNPDLDGEPMTPIVFPSEAATTVSEVETEAIESGQDVLTYQSRYQHIPSDQTLIIPYRTLLSLGGELKAVALRADALRGDADGSMATLLADRFGIMLFRGNVSGSGEKGAFLHYAANTLRYAGASNILIPLFISALILVNTMIGSVYERKREIAVYTSVGLAPSHVAFLFVAEALAFAVISVVAGYLLAQAAAVLLADTALWEGMTANYSSMAGILALCLVIGTVLLSALYPSRVAARIAIPDVTRSWTMPRPEGDSMTITLPFLMKVSEQDCAGGFLMEYYDSHRDVSHGGFSTSDMTCRFLPAEDAGPGTPEAEACFTMTFMAWLAPFDFGVRQDVNIRFCPSENYPGFREVRLRLTRQAGEQMAWRNLNKSFINGLRKQLLVWRSLDQAAREEYEKLLRDSMSQAEVVL